MADLDPNKDQDRDYASEILVLAEGMGIETIQCAVHNWPDTPHAHMDPDQFLDALEAEAESIGVMSLWSSRSTPTDLADILRACGIPWPDEDELSDLGNDQAKVLERVERDLQAIIKPYMTHGPRWASFEAVYDVSGPLLRVVTVEGE